MKIPAKLEGVSLNVDIRLAAGAAASLLAAGGVGGYLLCRRVLVRAYAERLEAELDATRAHYYGQLAKEGLLDPEADELPADYPSREDLERERDADIELFNGAFQLVERHDPDEDPERPLEPADASEAVPADGGDAVPEVGDGDSPPEVKNVFGDRDHTKPYPISLTDFCNVEAEWQQLTLHYYRPEQIVTDDKEEAVPNHAKLVGKVSDEIFDEELSEDPNIAYVRNVPMKMDFEIIRMESSYAETVLGYESPL
jgi:hypothetical protein